MGRLLRTERRKLVIQLRDEKGWTWERIAKEIGVKSKTTPYWIYYTEKNHKSKW